MLMKCDFIKLSNFIKKEIFPKIQTPNNYLYQCITTIYLFVLLKLQKYDQISEVIVKNNINDNSAMFVYKFLEAKYYFMIVRVYIYNRVIFKLQLRCITNY
jgi:hypothetical protein